MATAISTLVTRARRLILEALALITPISPLVAAQGATGATAYSYKIVATNATGHSIASAAGSITNGNAVQSGANFNRLNWVAVPRGTGYKVYRTVGGLSQGLIATLGDVQTYDDTGAAGDASAAPSDNTSGTLGSSQRWGDDELLDYAVAGMRDLWRSVIDLHQEHYFTIDATNVSVVAATEALSGVPVDCFRVLLIEPRDLTESSTLRALRFLPRKYNSKEMINARARGTIDPAEGGTVFYQLANAGSPIAAPSVYIRPLLSQAVPLRFVYIPTLSGSLALTDNNPVPGESDHAVVAWIVAYALSKDREDRSPDPNWIAVYGTEKASILMAATPRQEQEPIVRPGIFDTEYDEGDFF